MQSTTPDDQTQAELRERLDRLPNSDDWTFDVTTVRHIADHRLVEANAGDEEFHGVWTCADCGDSFLTPDGVRDRTDICCPV